MNIANRYEPNQSEMTSDRFGMFQVELENQINKLKGVQDYLDRVDFEYSPDFQSFLDLKNVNVEYLDPYNKAIFESQSYSYAVNLFIQRASGMNQWAKNRFVGNLSIQKVGGPKNTSYYVPTDDERTLYFMT